MQSPSFSDAIAQVVTHFEAIHHHLYRMLFLFIKLWQFIGIIDMSIDTHTHEPLPNQLLKQDGMFAFTLTNHGREYHQLGLSGQCHDLIDHFGH